MPKGERQTQDPQQWGERHGGEKTGETRVASRDQGCMDYQEEENECMHGQAGCEILECRQQFS